MGDCVEVLLAGSGTEEAPRGFAEILWIWWASEGQEVGSAIQEGGRRNGSEKGGGRGRKEGDHGESSLCLGLTNPSLSKQAASDSEATDNDDRASSQSPSPSPSASSAPGEAMMEVRWYWTPQELLPKVEDRAKCLLRELFESDRVDEIPVVRPSPSFACLALRDLLPLSFVSPLSCLPSSPPSPSSSRASPPRVRRRRSPSTTTSKSWRLSQGGQRGTEAKSRRERGRKGMERGRKGRERGRKWKSTCVAASITPPGQPS